MIRSTRLRFSLLVATAAIMPAVGVLATTPMIQQSSVGELTDIRAWLATSADKRDVDEEALTRPLSKVEAAQALTLLTADRLRTVAEVDAISFGNKAIQFDGKTLRWEHRVFGDAPAGHRSLWISLHGGGNAPPAVNDGQWRNQIRLYEPQEGIYLAPRAPTDTWNLWHEAHMDVMLQRLIDAAVAIDGVDPNRVYILGYSAGGDGVWQLAPRMADRFAAAATMAGHPGDASLAPLRNLPFAIFMGGDDSAYDRNKRAAEKTAELARLHAADAGGYTSMSRIYPGLPHWMNRKDAEALPWMATFTRDPWPKRVVWVQDDVTSNRFYWLGLPAGHVVKAGDRIDAAVDGQAITLTGAVPAGTILRLSDKLIDLDRPITVSVNGKRSFRGRVPRTAAAIRTSLIERADPASAATALLVLR